MLQPRLNNCIDCTTIPALLSDIDCKVTEFAKNEYNTTIFGFTPSVNREAFLDLLNYQRILKFKLCNPDYACQFTVSQIASKIKLLIHK